MDRVNCIPNLWVRMALNAFFLIWISLLCYGGSAQYINGAFPQLQLPEIWFLKWQMFRYYSPKHHLPFFEGRRSDGVWIPVDYHEFFHYSYDSGLRFERPDIWRSPHYQASLLRFVCKRYNNAHKENPIDRLRLGHLIWAKKLGSFNQESRRTRKVASKILYESLCPLN